MTGGTQRRAPPSDSRRVSSGTRRPSSNRSGFHRRLKTLAELWVPEVEQDHARKQALVEEATAAVGQVEAAIHAAEASLAAATARAEEARAQTAHYQAELEFRESEHARFTDLVQRRAVEQALLDEKLKQLHSAKAALAAADAGVASAEADQRVEQARLVEAKTSLAVTAARLKIAQAELKQTEVLMSYAVIRAPYDGVIIERAVDTGDFAQSAVSGKLEPLFTVIRAEPYRIVADVPESDAAWVRPGLPAKLTVNGISDRVFHGDVKRQSEALDSKSRTLRVEVELTDSDDRLRPGMYGFVEIFESSRD
ncbi:MAG: efflux RND transporter periplasmic adaptor subunit [Planctomycetes bacterium]|nr:efflux RND transporter periplasmic adaptor subunit [Planctomycetota bacterium]